VLYSHVHSACSFDGWIARQSPPLAASCVPLVPCCSAVCLDSRQIAGAGRCREEVGTRGKRSALSACSRCTGGPELVEALQPPRGTRDRPAHPNRSRLPVEMLGQNCSPSLSVLTVPLKRGAARGARHDGRATGRRGGAFARGASARNRPSQRESAGSRASAIHLPTGAPLEAQGGRWRCRFFRRCFAPLRRSPGSPAAKNCQRANQPAALTSPPDARRAGQIRAAACIIPSRPPPPAPQRPPRSTAAPRLAAPVHAVQPRWRGAPHTSFCSCWPPTSRSRSVSRRGFRRGIFLIAPLPARAAQLPRRLTSCRACRSRGEMAGHRHPGVQQVEKDHQVGQR
jgi:hypothetical protein